MVWRLVLPVTGCKYFDTKYAISTSNRNRNNFIVGQVTPEMLDGITYGTYILFGLLTMIGAAFIWFFVPETKRLSLEEMVRTYILTNTKANYLGYHLWIRGRCSSR